MQSSSSRSRVILGFLAILLALGLWYPPAPPPNPRAVSGGDIVLFRAVVDRMRGGEPYYATMRDELRKRGYPTASIFNWRPPVTFLLMAKASTVVHALMFALGMTALIATMHIFRGLPGFAKAVALILALGATVLPFLPTSGLYLPELWAGILLLLSVLAYSARLVRVAVCCGIAAVCARELALPYAIVSLALALREGRRCEIRWYAVGLTLFAAYYMAHIVAASTHILPEDMAHTRSWVAFGGWPFIVSVTAVGGWHILLPRWAAAIGAVLVTASLWSPADRHLKMMVGMYLSLFCIVGQAFNNSWGLLTGPTWGLAGAYGLIAVQGLFRSAMRQNSSGRPVWQD